MADNRKKIQHLLWRAGFGADPLTIKRLSALSINEVVDTIFADSRSSTTLEAIRGLAKEQNVQGMNKQQVDDLKGVSRIRQINLDIAWIQQMTATNQFLREKKTFFWHGHFACQTILGLWARKQNNTMRDMALGRFSDLLLAVSQDPAMLNFLNNVENKKAHPNENFAREVMELFTMGRGNYTENDIKNAARAFTGWSLKLTGEYDFRSYDHDFGEKTFLGKTGNLTGEDVLNIILEQRATADFITAKLYRFFVNDTLDADIHQQLSKQFYESGYNIEQLMRAIFTADWFYDDKNIGARIKSPVELLVGLQRTVPCRFESDMAIAFAQYVMGQLLFFPPNVAGWAGNRSWIDSTSLMFRLSLPKYLFTDDGFEIVDKPDSQVTDQQMLMTFETAKGDEINISKIRVNNYWEDYIKAFDAVKDDDIFEQVTSYLLQPQLSIDRSVIDAHTDRSSRLNYIKSLTVHIMSLPEYQLC